MSNVHWHQGDVTRAARAQALGGRGATVWFTGLSGSGKSTIASALERALLERGVRCYRLDGDNLRTGLNADLGFSDKDRAENIRRIGQVARLFADSGTIALVGAISPSRAMRDACRAAHENDRDGPLPFIEVFVDAPLDVCEARDPKGLYRKARAGAISDFTGIASGYEPPLKPDLTLLTGSMGVEDCVRACVAVLVARGVIAAR
ncbi:MAG: adenylyl-sulfate kinase [Phycisphaerales bacterium]